MEKVDRFLKSNLFTEAYDLLSKDHLSLEPLQIAIENADLKAIRSICEEAVEREIGEYSIHQLRKLARKMAIPYYTTYGKSELLSVLIQRKKNDVQAA